MIRYHSVVLICSDIRSSSAFYRDLFNLETEMEIEGLVSFREGISLWDKKVASELMYQGADLSPSQKRPGLEIYFETDDIDGFYAELQKRSVRCMHQIQVTPWNQRTVRFFDPDNHLIEVGESMEEIIRKFAREGKSEEEITRLTMMPADLVSVIMKD